VVVQDPTWYQLQSEDFAVNDERVTCVVPTLVAHHMGALLGDDVDYPSLTFVTPLGADHN
jgi:hypothetical protein